MNSPFRSALVFGFVSVIAVLPAQAAQQAKAAPKKTPAPRPIVRVDPTPVATSPGLVTSYADVVEPVQKAVVSIDLTKFTTERVNPLLRQLFPGMEPEHTDEQKGLGSGVIVSADGYILTNNHVVADADELKVHLADEREFVAKVIGADPKTDIAVIKIDATDLPTATLADSDKIRVGDVVFAVGNPLGVGQTVTMGIVSAKNRSVDILKDVGGYEDFIQTDAAINMGNSGGALIDARGRLVGINSAILSPSRGNIGIGFAVPINLAASTMNRLIETGSVTRGYLGVTADNVTPDVAEQIGLPSDAKGALVSDVEPGSPAEKGGLKRFDLITALDEHRITNYGELRLLISQIVPGTAAKLTVLRDGKELSLQVTLELPSKANELLAGVRVKPLLPEDRRRSGIADPRVTGLLVTEVESDSPHRDVFSEGAVIMEIKRQPVESIADARKLVKPGRNLFTIFYPGGVLRIVSVNVNPE